jgi:cysteinyl-tRNA synthetase
MFVLSSHYRSPVDFTWTRLGDAAKGMETLDAFISHAGAGTIGSMAGASHESAVIASSETKFHAAMEDDFNTPEALAALYDLRHAATHGKVDPGMAAETVQRLGHILGFFQKDSILDPNIEMLLIARDEARKKKDFATSDRIRKELTALGYVVEDTSGKTVVRKRA